MDYKFWVGMGIFIIGYFIFEYLIFRKQNKENEYEKELVEVLTSDKHKVKGRFE